LCAANALSVGVSGKLEYLGLTGITFWGSLSKLVLWYLTKLFIPINHVWIYSISPLSQMESLLNLLIVFILLGLFFLGFRRFETFRQISFAWGWFTMSFLFLLPGSLSHLEVGLVIEPYWFFIGSMGFFILIAFYFDQLKAVFSQVFFTLLLAAICLTLFCVTQRFNVIAKSQESYCKYWLSIVLNPVPLLTVANHAFQAKEYNKTLNYYEIYLKRFAVSAYAKYAPEYIYTKLAFIYSEKGNIDSAKAMIAKAFKLNKNYNDARVAAGLISLKEKDYRQAEANFLEAIDGDPNSTISRLNLVVIYHLTQQDQKAIDILKFLTRQDLGPDDRRNVYSRLAVLQFIHEGFEPSFDTVSALLLEDQSAQAYLAVAQSFEMFSFYEPAEILLRQGIRLYPKHKELNLFLEKTLKKQNVSVVSNQPVFNN
jgi:tetratricopeptide (TPR) repeat protein